MTYIDKLLIGICGKLQLPTELYNQADDRYQTISNRIENDAVFTDTELKMYAHGSFRLKTTVRPLKENEYDLDFVVQIPESDDMTPQQLYDHIFRILSSDGIHNDMVEKKSRCIRVNYKNDFHLDIMPGKLINAETNEIIVPDRELKGWYHHSNPIGYAEWFENQAKIRINEMYQRGMIIASAEPLSEQEMVAHLEPLRRATQLIKRYRDVYCDKNNKEPVRSIVLCTLLGQTNSEYLGEINIINDFCKHVNMKMADSDGEPFEVRNPVVDEVLTEKWSENQQNYEDFIDMMRSLTKDIQRLATLSTNTEAAELIKKMFGEEITVSVIKEQAEIVRLARENGTLGINANGVLNTLSEGILLRKNTFYGE